MHLLRDSWQFSFKITEKERAFHLKSLSLHALLVHSAILWHVLKIVLGIVFLSSYHFNKLKATICLYKPALRVRSAIFAYYCIKCKQSTPTYRHGGYA